MGKILSTCARRQTLSPEEIRRRRLQKYDPSQEELNEGDQSMLNEERKTADDSLLHNNISESESESIMGKLFSTVCPRRRQSTATAISSEEMRRRRVEMYEQNPDELNERDQSRVNEERKTNDDSVLHRPQEKEPENHNQVVEDQQKGLVHVESRLNQEDPKNHLDGTKPLNDSDNSIKKVVEAPVQSEPAIKRVSSQVPDYILMHPVYKDHGMKVYQMHVMFEEISTFTIYEASIQEKPHLKLLDNKKDESQSISLFSIENFDQIIQKVMKSESYYQKESKLTYLYDVFNRLQSRDWIDRLNTKELDELNKIVISYAVTYLVLPNSYSLYMTVEDHKNIFDCTSTLYETLYKHLKSYDREKFLQHFVINIPNKFLSRILQAILKRILRDCRQLTTDHTKDFMDGISLLEALMHSDKRVVEFIVNHKLFLPKGNRINGVNFQKLSIFGACLSLTTLPGESKADKLYFYEKENGQAQTNATIDSRISMLRSQIHISVDCVHRMMEHMIKVDQKYKRNIIDWFYKGLLLNNSRQKMMRTRAEISTDGWFINLMLLLLKFCEKILCETNRYPYWLDKIDITYLHGKDLFKDCLLLNNKPNPPAEKKEEDPKNGSAEDLEIKKEVSSSKSAFLTELVFLATHALLLHKDLNKWFYEHFLKKLREEYKAQGAKSQTYRDLFAKQLAYEVQLQDPYLFTQICRLMTFNVLLILHSYEIKVKDLDEVDQLFEQTDSIKNEDFTEKPSLPFYWAENLHDYLPFIRNFSPSTLIKSKLGFEILSDFILSVGKSGSWLGNPYLKAQYMNFMGSLLPAKVVKAKYKDESFRFLFKENPYYERHLIKGLVVMFVEVEKTGTHAQFYEKFSHRLSCCSIINYLLTTVFPHGKTSYVAKSLDKMAQEFYDIYLRFVMLYLNDIVCLLDEGYASLKKVKAYQDGTDVPNVENLTEEEKKTREKNYEGNKGNVRYFSLLLNSYYEMGACVTKVSPDFFLTAEIKDKFIANLNNSLQSLNGSKAISEIKVNNMAELRFDPKFLLKNIVQTYLNFSEREDFVRGVVSDERSFDIQLFHKTARLLKKYSIIDEEDLEPFEYFIIDLEKKAQEKTDEDEFMKELQDIPDEFYDPITTEIMKDPVLLPASKMIIDRLTIMKHLLSDENDPFNRSKLTKEMLIPQPEFRQKIQDFFKEKRENRKKDKDLLKP